VKIGFVPITIATAKGGWQHGRHRYRDLSLPVKGLSAEKMHRVTLVPGECLPHDRRFAIALGSTLFDPQRPEWLSKTHFIMLMRDEKLAQLQTHFDAESGVLAIAENGRVHRSNLKWFKRSAWRPSCCLI
jgi:hypothetical protein